MKVLILVRHGQAESNAGIILSSSLDRYPLTQHGVEQANGTAKELKKVQKIDRIFTSPILWAVQTAGIIANGTGINPAVDERLKEREMGRLNNVKFDSREMMLKAFWDEVESDYAEGLESWDSLKKRISGFMGGLSEGKVFLAVSHRDVIAAALGSVDARFDSDISADVLSIPTASISVIDLEAKEILSIGSDKIPAQLWG